MGFSGISGNNAGFGSFQMVTTQYFDETGKKVTLQELQARHEAHRAAAEKEFNETIVSDLREAVQADYRLQKTMTAQGNEFQAEGVDAPLSRQVTQYDETDERFDRFLDFKKCVQEVLALFSSIVGKSRDE
ncbi:MAG TPA: hypothetical protein VN457_08160, partial [Chlamydiales bacterium]|nr:hypothetical protein [Chlamydiales bacterium]